MQNLDHCNFKKKEFIKKELSVQRQKKRILEKSINGLIQAIDSIINLIPTVDHPVFYIYILYIKANIKQETGIKRERDKDVGSESKKMKTEN